MEDRVDVLEEIVDRIVRQIAHDHGNLASREILAASRRKIVDDRYRMAVLEQSPRDVRTNESCTAGDERLHDLSPAMICERS